LINEATRSSDQCSDYDMVQQVASTEYADGVDEFVKSGLTPMPSHIVTV
jgi:hypothetical protein